MVRRILQDAPDSVRLTRWARRLFPEGGLGTADWLFFAAIMAACFFLFLHPDLPMIGFCSVSYFDGVRGFYENARSAAVTTGFPKACGYLPTTYAVVALWLYPLKVLGFSVDHERFQTFASFLSQVQMLPTFQTYWLKALTSLSYATSGFVFYRIAQVYWPDDETAKYAAAAWLTMPLALFSQFIFSQVDIFYVLLTLIGMLMFLRGRVYMAALVFGVSITFKYFPAFVFLPLLLAFEKRILRVALGCLIFVTPLALIELAYHQSAAYLELVHGFYAVEWVYGFSVNAGGLQIYVLFVAFTVLCGVAYFTNMDRGGHPRVAAYIWLVASIMPFLLFFWNPQWIMFVAPPIALTSLMSRRFGSYAMLDLLGILTFIAYVSVGFPLNVDTVMIKAGWFGTELDYSFLSGELFDWFGTHSVGVFLSGFTGYLLLQLILKFKHVIVAKPNDGSVGVLHYGCVRRYFCLSLLILVLPAFLAACKDKMNDESVIGNRWVFWVASTHYGELERGRVFEQTFVAQEESVRWVSVLLTTFGKKSNEGFATSSNNEVAVEIVDEYGQIVASATRRASLLKDNRWNRFAIEADTLRRGGVYSVRLRSENASIGWWATLSDRYLSGRAIVDGAPLDTDFGFRIGFPRQHSRR